MIEIIGKELSKELTVVSLFDGIGTGLISLKELGYKCKYYASEIDEFSMRVAMKNHLEIVEMGNILKISYQRVELIQDSTIVFGDEKRCIGEVDLLLGGSPCNDLSVQQSLRTGLTGHQSKLFYEFVRLLSEIRPRYFLFENVRMSKADEQEITRLLQVEPIRINSKLLSGQKRDRLYWTNIPNVEQPSDLHIYLQDIIDSGYVDKDKSNCITESLSRQTPTPATARRYFMGFGQLIFDSKQEYDKIVGTTPQDRISFAKRMRSLPGGKQLVSGVDTPNVRMLTPNEAEKLQTLPIDYTYVESFYYSSKGYNKNRGNTKRLSMIGEGWTKDVITHILKNMEF